MHFLHQFFLLFFLLLREHPKFDFVFFNLLHQIYIFLQVLLVSWRVKFDGWFDIFINHIFLVFVCFLVSDFDPYFCMLFDPVFWVLLRQSLGPESHHVLFQLIFFIILRFKSFVYHYHGSMNVLNHLGFIFEIDHFVHEEMLLTEHEVPLGRNLVSTHIFAVGSVKLILDIFYQVVR